MAYRASLGELCATFVLVYVACGSGISVSQRLAPGLTPIGPGAGMTQEQVVYSVLGGMNGSILGSLTVALIAMALIYSFASISGAHMNPAVTIALWSSNRTSARKAAMYVIAQLIGANLAMLALFFSFNFDASIFSAAAVYPAPHSNPFSVFFMEFALTFILVFIILKVAFEDVEEEKRKTMSYKAVGGARGLTIYAPTSSSRLGFAPLAIGTTIGVLGTIGGSVSGGCYNPARYLAPALWSWSLDSWAFAYVLGELLGGCAAALMRHAFDVLGKMAHTQEDKAAELRQAQRQGQAAA
jgi:glycerol uptake facilitator-like aquaporin